MSDSESRSSGHSSKCDFSTSTEGASTSTNNHRREVPEELAAQETRDVRHSRWLVIVVLIAAATAAGVSTYIFSQKEENDSFESQFDDFAIEIDDITDHNARNVFGIVEGVTVTITSLSLFNNTVWPYFTLPHCEIRIGDLLDTTGADFAAFSPVITDDTKAIWEAYALENQGWIQDGLKLTGDLEEDKITSIPTAIYPEKVVEAHDEEVHYLPVWQTFPAPKDPSIVNFDLLSDPAFHRIFDYVVENKEPVLSEVVNVTNLFGDSAPDLHDHPQSLFVQPVYHSFGGNSVVVAILTTVLPWELYFTDLLHQEADGIVCVLRNTCGDVFTYMINGPEAIYIGKGDYHDPEYDHLLHVTDFSPQLKDKDNKAADANCEYSFFIYPSDQLHEKYTSKRPALLTGAVIVVFIFTSMVFLAYDYLVQQRQTILMNSAQKTNAIVSSIFPAEIRDRIFKNGDSQKAKKSSKKQQGKKGGFLPGFNNTTTFGLKNFLNENDPDNDTSEGNLNEDNVSGDLLANELFESKPIADLFPHTTVMFADIAGFTAWSSVREPSQVFTLLETVYRGFDIIAKRRRVFKVETIGDCYVSVCGLPEARKDHAVVMARFARNCLERMHELTQMLEITLGPDTGELTIRVGLHSGPVTAGVLRGEKSRFQLFGDTVNTAARLESTGERDRIHISEETANLLDAAGKSHWFKARAEKVVAKGKGELQTYWLHTKDGPGSSDGNHESEKKQAGRDIPASKADATAEEAQGTSSIQEKRLMEAHTSAKIQRLVGWNVEVLLRLLKQIVAARHDAAAVQHDVAVRRLESQMGKGSTVLDEVAEFVTLPEFDNSKPAMRMDPKEVVISPMVVTQLREYVTLIASMYQGNAFHSFEHASHVTMSVSKLLSRIVAQDMSGVTGDENDGTHHVHDGTYGITSDPLTQFSVVLAALIHDVDHRGVPNFLLIQENARLAAMYNNKSVAEQNSVDLAWENLMDDKFDKLRSCIYTNTEELVRFRQLIVNTVMATDIFDKELSALRRNRWDKAFSKTSNQCLDEVNRKATIVIEHLIQASDVTHTMQHWQIYCKWNERLFQEMYDAYRTGRSDNDPSLGWYKGELGFFDNYIIPLARKLKDCGVFGVSSDEYLNYALENRREWSAQGEEVVKKMIEKYCTDEAKPSHD